MFQELNQVSRLLRALCLLLYIRERGLSGAFSVSPKISHLSRKKLLVVAGPFLFLCSLWCISASSTLSALGNTKGIFISLEKKNRSCLLLRTFSPCLGCCKHSPCKKTAKKPKQKKHHKKIQMKNLPKNKLLVSLYLKQKNRDDRCSQTLWVCSF